MKLSNVHDFPTIDAYVEYKIAEYSKKEKTFASLFSLMFDEKDNVMAETSDGYRIKKITYGEYKQNILDTIPAIASAFEEISKGKMVGLYMSNDLDWLVYFWGILGAGYSPLVMNTRLPDEVLEGVLRDYGVEGVISDGKIFSKKTVKKEEICPTAGGEVPAVFGEEVIFMSSGTTNNVKLCAYTGENFYYQICDSARIIRECPGIKQHYQGELKQLMLLPLCHVFGFIAVYLWFGFFSRTFVFPKDLNPDTIRRTVKKHQVTHIFAVPMVWEAVHKAALRKIKERGEKTYRKFLFTAKLVNRLGQKGDWLAKKLLGEVREGLFGDSVQFLISGGSHIKAETLRFFNGIGYHLANGYGMTEIGITSVETASKKSILNTASIGAPFDYTEYRLSEAGVLLVRGKTRASRIMQNGQSQAVDFDQWFSTGDIMRCEGGRYYFDGREDDLIVSEDGENINPLLVEISLQVEGADRVCILRGQKGIMVVASVPGIFSDTKLKDIYRSILSQLEAQKLSHCVKKILFTHEALLRQGEFKISRRKLSERVDSGDMRTFDPLHIEEHVKELSDGLEKEIALCFAEALGKDVAHIGPDDDFFLQLEGTSLDYFALLGQLKARFGVDMISSGGAKLSTVKAFAQAIKNEFQK